MAQFVEILNFLGAQIGQGVTGHVPVVQVFDALVLVNGPLLLDPQFHLFHGAELFVPAFLVSVVPSLAIIAVLLVQTDILVKLGKHVAR